MSFRVTPKEWLLQLWRTLVPEQYSYPIETEKDGQGLDLTAQSAAIFGRASEAASVTTQAYYLKPHSIQDNPPGAGAEASIGFIEISRLAPAVGPITVPAGTGVLARVKHADGTVSDGERFVTSSSVTIPSGDLGPYSVDIQALRVGYQGNVDAGSIELFSLRGRASVPNATSTAINQLFDSAVPDQFAQAMIGQYVRFTSGPNVNTVPRQITSFATGSVKVDGPALIAGVGNVEVEEWADIGLLVSQKTGTFDGRHGWLDAIGQDRNVFRVSGESDEAYRERVCELADVVSPGAIQRAAARVLTPLGIPFVIKEAGDGLPGLVYDFSPYDVTSGTTSMYVPDRRFFLVCVGNSNLGEFGFAYDAVDQANAYDATGTTPPVVNFYDGYPVIYFQALQSLWQTLNQTRAAGVGFAIVRDYTL